MFQDAPSDAKSKGECSSIAMSAPTDSNISLSIRGKHFLPGIRACEKAPEFGWFYKAQDEQCQWKWTIKTYYNFQKNKLL